MMQSPRLITDAPINCFIALHHMIGKASKEFVKHCYVAKVKAAHSLSTIIKYKCIGYNICFFELHNKMITNRLIAGIYNVSVSNKMYIKFPTSM